jgi:two-component system sensor histidine kinase RegB
MGPLATETLAPVRSSKVLAMNNPFALLLLAPVTIAATVLRLRSVIGLGLLAIGMVTILLQSYLPIIMPDGQPLQLDPTYQVGQFIALTVGIGFLTVYTRQVTTETQAMSDALTATQMALAREQKLTDLAGLIAATAHELGTPLATIKLVSSELRDELSDRDDLREDLELIHQQADRCRDILHSMGRAGKEDEHLKRAPIEAIVREAADPHPERGTTVMFDLEVTDKPQPVILRRPEIIHGLRNLIQNAVDFAKTEVAITITWSEGVSVRIADDGPGFPATLMGRIGDPFLRRRRAEATLPGRPGYEGMGLGLFIAKTLLERTGASVSVANGPMGYGGIAMVDWRLPPTDKQGHGGRWGK